MTTTTTTTTTASARIVLRYTNVAVRHPCPLCYVSTKSSGFDFYLADPDNRSVKCSCPDCDADHRPADVGESSLGTWDLCPRCGRDHAPDLADALDRYLHAGPAARRESAGFYRPETATGETTPAFQQIEAQVDAVLLSGEADITAAQLDRAAAIIDSYREDDDPDLPPF